MKIQLEGCRIEIFRLEMDVCCQNPACNQQSQFNAAIGLTVVCPNCGAEYKIAVECKLQSLKIGSAVELVKRIDFTGSYVMPGLTGELKCIDNELVVEVKDVVDHFRDSRPYILQINYRPDEWRQVRHEKDYEEKVNDS